MKHRNLRIALVVVVLLAATVMRLYDLKNVPGGFFCDEAAFGYNGFAIGKTGYDENGNFLPLLVWSFGGYKNTVYIYTTALTTRLFGTDEFTTRLPAAIYGVGSIWALYLLGSALFNPWVGLFAAIFLTIAPWHLHFSRIAFEMTPFAFLFTLGAYFLVRFTQGRRTLVAGVFLCALCPYNYAISTVFVPLFFLGFGLLYLPTLLRRWKETLLAVVVAIVTVVPLGIFYYRNPQGSMYLQRTTMIDLHQPLLPQAQRYFDGYKEFFTPRFLFEHGDTISRHSVREFGELLPVFAPFLVLGIVAALFRRERFSKLLLWWLVCYPVGASLLTEIPSATRSFIGVPVFCLLAGLGLAAALWVLTGLRWRPLVLTLQAAALVAVGYFATIETTAYMLFYFNDYPKYSAPTYGGFQYGYRESIQFMEPLRAHYDRLMMTATEVNQPQIFPLFYNQVDPIEYKKTRDIGYLIADPAFYSEYTIAKPILYQLRTQDLSYFNDYDVKKRIVAPGGQEEFVIAEVRSRKAFLNKWLGLGLYENENNQGTKTDFIDPKKVSKDRYKGAWGDIYWRPISQRNVKVDLNTFYALADPRHPNNPEFVCAYTATTVHSTVAQKVFLELAGSGDPAQLWLNGQSLTPWPLNLGVTPIRKEIALGAGNNLLMVKSCESVGDWYFIARLTDDQGHDAPNLTFDAEIPTDVVPAASAPLPSADMQMIEGFDSIVRFKHTQSPYPDYRGGTESWWSYLHDPESEVVWLSAVPKVKKRTVAVLTASMSEVSFDGELYVNGKFVLPFTLPEDRGVNSWVNGPYRMTFVYKIETGGRSGVLLIDIPEDQITPGKPLELRIVPAKGDNGGWFMIKGYKDTLTYEGYTPEQIVAMVKGDWQPTAKP